MKPSEDAMQDAWVALLERGGPSSVEQPRRWLLRTAHNCALAEIRAETRERAALREAAGCLPSEAWVDYLAERNRKSRESYAALTTERKKEILVRGAQSNKRARAKENPPQWVLNERLRMKKRKRRPMTDEEKFAKKEYDRTRYEAGKV